MLLRQFTARVQTVTNSGSVVVVVVRKDTQRKLPDLPSTLTSIEEQLPCCNLKVLEDFMQHIKLRSEERKHVSLVFHVC